MKNSVVHEAYETYPDKIKKDAIENLTETLIYDRLGSYLRR